MTKTNSSWQSPSPRVTVVVLTWNGKRLTLECLESLAKLTYDNIDIVVVDNASTDGTADAISDVYGDRVTVIVNDANLGFAGGNNVGIQHALSAGAEYILLLNNDTLVDPGMAGALADALSGSADIGIVGPKIYYASPPDQIWYAGGRINLARGTARHIGIRETDTGQYDTVKDVDYVTGCALMARREVIERIGFLDTAFEAYYEDADFCMRARQAGYRIIYVPAGRVWHRISSSTGGQLSTKKISLKLGSTWTFFRRYASLHHWITMPFFFAADVVRILWLAATGRIRDSGSTGG
ncbi:MAG: glycosyltransferase family 2 protein [Candidatus Latescibacterota bacterium]|nr:MAG: glycosyltransferase family 2 protein [Candidatus Latescibacterota bacterium]